MVQSPVTFTVQMKDLSGHIDTGYTGRVHFTGGDPNAILPQDYTFTAADAGQATFTATFNSFGVRSITITDTAAPNNKVGYQTTVVGVMLQIGGVLGINGTGGNDTISVTQSGSTSTATLNGAVETFPADQVQSVSLTANAGDDVVTITSDSPVFSNNSSIDLGTGNDTFNWAFNSIGVTSILGGTGNDVVMDQPGSGGTLSFATAGGGPTLNFQMIPGQPVTINGATISTLGKSLINTIATVTIHGTSGDDVINSTSNSAPIVFNAGDGNDQANFTGGSSLTLTGGNGDDTLNGYDRITHVFGTSLNGGAGNDFLNMTSASTDDTIQLQGTTLRLNNNTNPVFWSSDVENISLSGAGGNDTLSVSGYGGNVTLDGGDGDDVLTLSSVPKSISLTGGDGNDTLTASSSVSGSVTFDGQGGTDSVSLTGGSTADSFTITPTSATQSINGKQLTVNLANVETRTLSGGAGSDSVIVDASSFADDHRWDISDSQLSLDGSTFATLSTMENISMIGGSGRDRYFVTPSATVPFTISGGTPQTAPGDLIALVLSGVTGAILTPGGTGAGTYTFTNRKSIGFSGIESCDNLQSPRLSSSTFDPAGQKLLLGFDDDVSDSLAAAALELSNLTTGQSPSSSGAAMTYDFANNLAQFALAGAGLPDGNYHAVLAGGIADASGNALGSTLSVDFFILAGDANHDRHVDTLDFVTLAQNFGQGTANFARGDFTGDGRVNALDFNVLATNFGAYLAPLAAPASILAASFGPAVVTPDLFSRTEIANALRQIVS